MKRKKQAGALRVAVIGAGKVGQVLGRILADNGERIVCVVSRTERSAAAGARFLRCRRYDVSTEAVPAETNLVMITTPHGAVESVAGALADSHLLNFRRLAVCHASGMLTAAVLRPLAQRGATVFSFHPLQTFPREFAPRDIVPTARGIYFGVDGTAQGLRKARNLARRLGGKVYVVPPEMRAFYHAACVVASNHLTTMLAVLEKMYAALGRNGAGFFPLFRPIIEATLRNVEMSSPARALSGPVARGGVETVAAHFDSLVAFAPGLIPYFAAVSKETVRLALEKGSIDRARAEEMNSLLATFSSHNAPAQDTR